MTNTFIQNNAATHFGIDCEDFAEACQFDEMCGATWPVWIVYRNGQPIGWYDELNEVACVV